MTLDAKHIFLGIALVVALILGTLAIESREVAIAEGKAAVAEAQLTAAKQTAAQSALANAALQKQQDAVQAQLTATNVQLATVNSQLASLAKQQAAALATQKQTDTQMGPNEQASRWQQLVPTAKVSVLADLTGFEVDTKGGLATLLQLEEVPALQAQLDAATKQVNNDDQHIANDAVILAAEVDKHKSDVANDAAQLVESKAETAKVSADFNLYKKKARKRLLVVAVTAYVAGYLTNVFTKGGL